MLRELDNYSIKVYEKLQLRNKKAEKDIDEVKKQFKETKSQIQLTLLKVK